MVAKRAWTVFVSPAYCDGLIRAFLYEIRYTPFHYSYIFTQCNFLFVSDCRAVCHPDCKDAVPLPCIPSNFTPGSGQKRRVRNDTLS